MVPRILALAIALLATGCAGVTLRWPSSAPAKARASSGTLGGGLLGPAKQDAYGPGVHSDATGRPFEWQTDDGQVERGAVKPDAYGPGAGMDAYGRPVRAQPLQ